MAIDLKPNFERSPNLLDIVNSYSSAEIALVAGNYCAALVKAKEEKNQIVEGAALTMFGLIEDGLTKTKSKGSIYDVFGQWCLNDLDAAISLSKQYHELDSLRLLLEKETINILIICGPHTEAGIPFKNLDRFVLSSYTVERHQNISSIAEIMPKGFIPNVILVMDVYGHRLPDDLYELDVPIVFLTYDFDLQLPNQYEDLQRASLIIGNSAYEHFYLEKIYQSPVTSANNWYNFLSVLPENILSPNGRNLTRPHSDKTLDFLHTGLSFTPLMRDKAQFLYRIATLDAPDLNINIHHGFMNAEDYQTTIGQTKFMPIFNSRMCGSLQTRTSDALCNGSFVLHGGGDSASILMKSGKYMICSSSSSTLEEDCLKSLSRYPTLTDQLIKHGNNLSNELKALLLTKRERAVRFLKFCLFEISRTKYVPKELGGLRSVSAYSLHQCLKRAQKEKGNSHTLYSLALFRAIEDTLRNPNNQEKHQLVQSIYDIGILHHPQSLPLMFNFARYQWMTDKKNQAFETFKNLIGSIHISQFEPERNMIWIQFFDDSVEMMPHQDYFLAVSRDIAAKNSHLARNIIEATALCYMGLHRLQNDMMSEGIDYLEKALNSFPEHFPAARLKFKTLYTRGIDWKSISKAFELAVILYPPVLTELMSYGVNAELNQNNNNEALQIVKTWVYYIIRCTWDKGKGPIIPTSNWQTVRKFFNHLPKELQKKLKEKFPNEFTSCTISN